uniref:Uncharacterized protein n=1 Tax=Fagus sylvatica TaxID=28930 RepID=A0A2N9HLD9_FAGSY
MTSLYSNIIRSSDLLALISDMNLFLEELSHSILSLSSEISRSAGLPLLSEGLEAAKEGGLEVAEEGGLGIDGERTWFEIGGEEKKRMA